MTAHMVGVGVPGRVYIRLCPLGVLGSYTIPSYPAVLVVVVVGSLHAGGEARKEPSSDVHEAKKNRHSEYRQSISTALSALSAQVPYPLCALSDRVSDSTHGECWVNSV